MTDLIPFSDWEKIELKVGKICNVEDHPNADKLYVLKVDFGEEKERTIVAGLKQYCDKKGLEGKRAIFVTNLEPVVLRGIESHGMILAAINHEHTEACVLTPDSKDIDVGTKIR